MIKVEIEKVKNGYSVTCRGPCSKEVYVFVDLNSALERTTCYLKNEEEEAEQFKQRVLERRKCTG